jgi:drug/metabolite transporter (DMT)-like permease
MDNENVEKRRAGRSSAGVLMGGGAILMWSLSPTCILFAGKQLGVWQFLATAALLSAFLQVIGYLALGRRLRAILLPPAKLWIAIALGYVFYLLLFTTGMVTARTETQAVGVSLMNYLWPTLAILFTTWVVPGERLHGRLAVAVALALAGVLLANGADLALPGLGGSLWPYVLGGGAAVSWAAYCALTSRWRSWARHYAAAPMGFLVVAAVGAVVCCSVHQWQPMSARAWGGVLLISLGPWAGGYMLWEMALHRVSSITLGLMGAVTPVLATATLIGVFALTAPGRVSATRVAVLLAAAALISVAVAVGTSSAEAPGRLDAGAR